MKATELNSKTIPELKELLNSLRKESFNLRIQKANGNIEGLNRFRVVRKNIARIKTIITQKCKIEVLGSDK